MRGACQVADLTLMIRATRGRSRSTNHWKGSWIVYWDPKSLDLRWGAASCGDLHDSFFKTFFGTRFFPIFFDVGSILGGFGSPKWKPKSIFGMFFSMFFSSAFRHRFLMVFGRLET